MAGQGQIKSIDNTDSWTIHNPVNLLHLTKRAFLSIASRYKNIMKNEDTKGEEDE